MLNTPMQWQRWRHCLQMGFFILFVMAPPLDLFRLDLDLGHFIILGKNWTLGIGELAQQQISTTDAIFRLVFLVFVPLLSLVLIFIVVSWFYGRVYCGWLCPHFSVVETINQLMVKAIGKPSLWESKPLLGHQAQAIYWLAVIPAVIGFGFLWALTLLSYLIAPFTLYYNLWHGSLSQFQFIFLTVASLVFSLEFLLARHLFCRFGCAVGLFQSLVWMANPKAMLVRFDKTRAKHCQSCQQVCDQVCPMRLKPRTIKRKMFTCTQCGQCIAGCYQVQALQFSLLNWTKSNPNSKI